MVTTDNAITAIPPNKYALISSGGDIVYRYSQ